MNIHLNYFTALCVLVLVFKVAYKYLLIGNSFGSNSDFSERKR